MLTNNTTIGSAALQKEHGRSLRRADAVAVVAAFLLVHLLGVGAVLLLPALGVIAGRVLVRRARSGSHPSRGTLPRALVVGDLASVMDLLADLRERPPTDIDQVAAYVPAAGQMRAADGVPPHAAPDGRDARVEAIVGACVEHRIETVVLTVSAPLTEEEIQHLHRRLHHAHVFLDVAHPAGHRIRREPTPEMR